MRDSPSGRVPNQAPRRFVVATEACGGGTPDLSYILMFLGYVDLYRQKKSIGGASRGPGDRGAYPGGGRALLSPGFLDLPWLELQVSRIISFPKITLPKVSFHLDSV